MSLAIIGLPAAVTFMSFDLALVLVNRFYVKKGRQPVYETQPVYDKEGNLVPVLTAQQRALGTY